MTRTFSSRGTEILSHIDGSVFFVRMNDPRAADLAAGRRVDGIAQYAN
jgi:hypothetical protein